MNETMPDDESGSRTRLLSEHPQGFVSLSPAPAALTFLPFTMSEEESAFMEQMAEMSRHITRVFAIPPQLLGVITVEGSIEDVK